MAYGTVNADVIGTSVTGSNIGAGNASIMKNRIINGAMVISQRNGTSSVTPASADYVIDRFVYFASQASKFTAQQLSASPPVGFSNYLGLTVASAVSVGAGDYFDIQQPIEGFNTADLQWGTANAKTVTLSFWVQSSLTGTFGGALSNSGNSRSYPFTYTISSANTWTSISVTIAGDTTGTWVGATNGVGLRVIFGLGVGSTYNGTAGSWAGSNYISATGATSVVGTSGATFYITGVQLEVGSSATGYEYRQYQQELALCQRYFEDCGTGTSQGYLASGFFQSVSQARAVLRYKVQKRTTPTLSLNGTTIYWESSSGLGSSANITASFDNPSPQAVLVYSNGLSYTSGIGATLHEANSATTQLWVSAEL